MEVAVGANPDLYPKEAEANKSRKKKLDEVLDR